MLSDLSGQFTTQRTLALLSAAQYRSSLVSLFGAGMPDEVDSLIAEIAEQEAENPVDYATVAVDADRLGRYFKLAKLTSTSYWAEAQFLSDEIKSLQGLQDYFVDDFALRAFRRPLTMEEKTYFENLLTDHPEPFAGLHQALYTLLSSPNFLYVAQLGEPRTQIAEQGWSYEFDSAFGFTDGFGGVTITGEHLFTEGAVDYRNLEEIFYSFDREYSDQYTNYFSPGETRGQNLFFYPMSKVEVRVTGAEEGEADFELSIDDVYLRSQTVPNSQRHSYSFIIEGYDGEHQLQISNGWRALRIESVRVAPAVHLALPPSREALQSHDENAWLLTPFEVASALALRYGSGVPDHPLLEKAMTGELHEPGAVESEIERLETIRSTSASEGM